ncbi:MULTISPECIES: hypothetical protein [unclassified Roseateles]|uniref:hypothetical protein n=1 Tax=unclassified Roseateles TaxID=2626991 RepID=UPI00070012F9|nr:MULTISPECIES: hypothetical protein [unclassified Roseateles]KQW51376.1 hypothetical protein ASC81_01635 [Pelomonas sp. Root405]KRA77608.1 hypothetical protein ASD88_01635 [Pelomonas sp. Root662]
MPIDAQLPLSHALETSPQRPPWAPLARWLSTTAASTEAALGYESALPWTLGVDGPADGVQPPY